MHYEIYRDRSNYWRWRLKANNSLIIADSGQGYVNQQDCLHGIGLVQQSVGVPVYQV